MKSKSLKLGIIAVASPIPMFLITALWSLLVFFVIGIGVLHYESTTPDWLLGFSLLPLLISPLMCCIFIVRGIVKRKEHLSWLCILLSVVGLIENALLLMGICYLGSGV